MNELSHAVLATESALPMGMTGWVVLIVSLSITAVWLAHLYR